MFVSSKINQKTLLNFVEKFKEIGHLQQMGIIKDGELLLKFAVEPYEVSDVKQLFSISKTFTSMAIGLAISEGKIGLHDKVVDFFRGTFPFECSSSVEKMEVYHLLTMTTGHDSCVMNKIGPTMNPVKTFLELPLQHEPGEYFAYNTGASLILAVLIKIVTGKELDEYLKPMLDGLEIKDYYFEKIGGACLGGVGTHVNIQALLNVGEMLLNKGLFKGKQLVSEEYVKLATSNLVDNSHNGSPDWTSGYGLHLWMGQEGFRCDGAYGQLIIVLPEINLVLAIQAVVDNMQKEVDLVRELLKDIFYSFEVEDIMSKINEVYRIENTKVFDKDLKIKFKDNELKINGLSIRNNINHIALEFNGDNNFEILAGNGSYMKSKFKAYGVKAKIAGLPNMYEESIVSSYYLYENNVLNVVMKNHNTPLIQNIIIDLNKDEIIINNKTLKIE